MLIREAVSVGKIHGQHKVYKIKSVAFLQHDFEESDLRLQPCPKHGSTRKQTTLFDVPKNAALTKTWGTLKSAGNTIKNTTQQAAAIATGTPKKKDKEKFEKRIIDEFYKIFNDSDSFYFCRSCDITCSLQRLCELEKEKKKTDNKALWKNVDERFFWNRHMLKEFVDSQVNCKIVLVLNDNSISEIMTNDGKVYSDHADIVNRFNKHYTSVGKTLSSDFSQPNDSTFNTSN